MYPTRVRTFDSLERMRTHDAEWDRSAPPTWRDALVLNIGVGVIPEMKVEVGLGEREDLYQPIIHLDLVFNFVEARYRATFVGYEGPDVTSVDLRSVRVNELVQLGASHGIFVKLNADEPPASLHEWFGGFGEPAYSAEFRAAGPTQEVLRHVALSYQLAHISSQPPAKAVERQFELPPRTAARWIARAKELGILTTPSVIGFERAASEPGQVVELTDITDGAWRNIGEHQAEA